MSAERFMDYLIISLLILACTPLIVRLTERFQRFSKIFAFFLIVAIAYNIFAHILLENMRAFGWEAIIAALAGALLFGGGDDFFFGQPRRSSGIFLVLVQVFLLVHAMIDGAALVGSELPAGVAGGEHQHSAELSLSIVFHRLLFEVFVWKFFLDRYGRWSAAMVLVNIALGTVIGFFGSRALFHAIPSYFGIFEAFIGGALLHLVYDYTKERLNLKGPASHLTRSCLRKGRSTATVTAEAGPLETKV